MLDPDRQAHRVLGDARQLELGRVELGVGGARGVDGERLRVADVRQVAEELEPLDEAPAGLPPALDPERHEVAKRILKGGFGSILTFGIDGGREAGSKFIDSLKLFSHLANIGDAKSLAIHPPTTTHSQLNEEELNLAGVSQDMVRLSVGIEHIDDIIADLEQALAAI